jgi:uncharacterized repeat protein (TIGR04076 family)
LDKGHDLTIEVEEIRGKCPVYEVGDRMVFRDGYRLDLGETDALCSHAMGSLLPFLSSLSRGISPEAIGLSRGDDCGRVQCPDPGQPHTHGGTVTFRIRRS